MTIYYEDPHVTVWHGDCVKVLAGMPDNHFDAVITDPPYALSFMSRSWDGWDTPAAFQTWCETWAAECLRVLKPGGHLLAFGGTRTWHRLVCAVEDAGFEIRDSVAWLYGSGFPKSLDVSKAIDKVNGDGGRPYRFTAWMRTTGLTARQLDSFTGTNMGGHYLTATAQPAIPTPALWALIRSHCGTIPLWVDELVQRIEAERQYLGMSDEMFGRKSGIGNATEGHYTVGGTQAAAYAITAPATVEAQQWAGYGTAMKPGHEPICVARKTLEGTVAGNVLKWGTGAVNIDAMRIDVGQSDPLRTATYVGSNPGTAGHTMGDGWTNQGQNVPMWSGAGRWPANVVLDEETAATLDQQTGELHSQDPATRRAGARSGGTFGMGESTGNAYADSGGASRFFYTAKAPADERVTIDGVSHVTVKPLDLMQWLIRGYAGPKGALILDPFAGSGTTGEAAIAEGMRVVLIEQDETYLPLIKARVTRRTDPVEHLRTVGEDLGLFGLEESL